jgi:four helix bundle protein
MVQQVRRASLSTHLNIGEGCSRKSAAERKRFFEISRGSLIKVDAALDVAAKPGYCQKEIIPDLGSHMLACFKMLSSLIQKNTTK